MKIEYNPLASQLLVFYYWFKSHHLKLVGYWLYLSLTNEPWLNKNFRSLIIPVFRAIILKNISHNQQSIQKTFIMRLYFFLLSIWLWDIASCFYLNLRKIITTTPLIHFNRPLNPRSQLHQEQRFPLRSIRLASFPSHHSRHQLLPMWRKICTWWIQRIRSS